MQLNVDEICEAIKLSCFSNKLLADKNAIIVKRPYFFPQNCLYNYKRTMRHLSGNNPLGNKLRSPYLSHV